MVYIQQILFYVLPEAFQSFLELKPTLAVGHADLQAPKMIAPDTSKVAARYERSKLTYVDIAAASNVATQLADQAISSAATSALSASQSHGARLFVLQVVRRTSTAHRGVEHRYALEMNALTPKGEQRAAQHTNVPLEPESEPVEG